MKKIALIAAALALGACSHMEIARPDSSKLVCAPEPALPAGPLVTDEEDATYKRELRGAWHSCHSTVNYLRDWFAKLPD